MTSLRYHRRIQDLLGDGFLTERPIEKLNSFAHKKGFTIPSAFLEWAAFDGASICQRFSNDDHFVDVKPELIDLANEQRGLTFAYENQGNFVLACLLDGTDDPPVLFREAGQESWIDYADSFSDAIFCQIFDWQFMLEFSEYDDKEIAYYSCFSVPATQLAEELFSQHAKLPRTQTSASGRTITQCRIAFSPDTRAVTQESDNLCAFTVMGESTELVNQREDELLAYFGETVEAPSHRALLFAILDFDRHIQGGRSILKLKTLFENQPGEASVKHLIAFCATTPLKSLRTADWDKADHDTPDGSNFVLNLPESNLQISITKYGDYQWKLSRLTGFSNE